MLVILIVCRIEPIAFSPAATVHEWFGSGHRKMIAISFVRDEGSRTYASAIHMALVSILNA
jgi:hypothetical protein